MLYLFSLNFLLSSCSLTYSYSNPPGSYIPSQFSGVRRCKWLGCREVFEDAVEAFKHIRDQHLKVQPVGEGKRKMEEEVAERKSEDVENGGKRVRQGNR